MPLKASLQPDHIPVNKFSLAIVGLVSFTFTTVGALEEEIDKVMLPDRTAATGGNSKPIEFTGTTPLHHTVENAALELWFNEAKDPVSATYKKFATLTLTSGTGAIKRRYTLLGLWISKRKTPELDMNDEGSLAVAEWTFSADSLVPI
jgi:hypothetical protein